MKIKILIPVYNDWQSVSKLVDEIENLSIDSKFEISVIVVNDASNHDRQNEDKSLDKISSVKILNMKMQSVIINNGINLKEWVFLLLEKFNQKK